MPIRYVTIDSKLTISIPDDDEVERVIGLYRSEKSDFLEKINRYVYLYRIMYKCVEVINDR